MQTPEERFAAPQHVELDRIEVLLDRLVEDVGDIIRGNRLPDVQAYEDVALLNPLLGGRPALPHRRHDQGGHRWHHRRWWLRCYR